MNLLIVIGGWMIGWLLVNKVSGQYQMWGFVGWFILWAGICRALVK